MPKIKPIHKGFTYREFCIKRHDTHNLILTKNGSKVGFYANFTGALIGIVERDLENAGDIKDVIKHINDFKKFLGVKNGRNN